MAQFFLLKIICKDGYNDGCDWYELNDPDGCPDFGYTPGTGDTGNATANEACCVCGGGFEGFLPSATPSLSSEPTMSNPPTQIPTISMMPSVPCFNLEGWIGKVNFVLMIQ